MTGFFYTSETVVQQIVIGLSSYPLAQQIANKMQQRYLHVHHEAQSSITFTDEQCAIIKESYATIIHAVAEHPEQQLQEAIALCVAARTAGAVCIRLVMPYFAYGREFGIDGPSLALQDAAHKIHAAADIVVCVDVHRMETMELFRTSFLHIQPSMFIADIIPQLYPDKKFIVVAPDEGARHRAQRLAQDLGRPVIFLTKKRSADGMHVQCNARIPAGMTALIVDDILDTGATLAAVAQALQPHVQDIIACITHPVCSRPVADYLDDIPLTRLFVSNSLASAEHPKLAVMDISDALAMTLNRFKIL